ncbi:hypothetical protein PCANB_002471 [Pneumocystis canis]|nr:hypothetical protein PCANB_002471 [Pneumocystis canis]
MFFINNYNFAEPITLPYEYHSLPNNIPLYSKELFKTIFNIYTSSLNYYEDLNKNILFWSEQIEKWEELIEKKRLFKAKKIAPGYLDTKERFLKPNLTKHL